MRKPAGVHSSIDISSVAYFSVAYLNNVDDTRLIIDRVDDSIVTLAYTIEV